MSTYYILVPEVIMEKGEATVPILKARFSGRVRQFQNSQTSVRKVGWHRGTKEGHLTLPWGFRKALGRK